MTALPSCSEAVLKLVWTAICQRHDYDCLLLKLSETRVIPETAAEKAGDAGCCLGDAVWCFAALGMIPGTAAGIVL